MSNINELVSLYTEDHRVRKIAAQLYNESPVAILLNGCAGAVDCYILSGLYLSDKKSQIYIASDKEEAAYIQNTLQSVFENKTVHFFPDSFKRPLLFEELDKNNVLLRTEISPKIHLNKGEKSILN